MIRYKKKIRSWEL